MRPDPPPPGEDDPPAGDPSRDAGTQEGTGKDTGGDAEHRAGFCPLVGLPNVGKSTLLNRLVGVELAIVTPKAQTTRARMEGIYSDETHQAVFVDTPGILEPRYLLQEAMLEEAERSLEGADVPVYVADAGYAPSLDAAASSGLPGRFAAVLCLNKIDRIPADRLEEIQRTLGDQGWAAVVPVRARTGEGVDRLRREVLRRLPPSPPFYPRDQVAAAPVRDFVAEFVREACFLELEEEVPYSVAVRVEQYREEEEPVYISAVVFVERDSQKGIVIGEGGRMIRTIGQRARGRIEEFVGEQVYLDLWVKVLPKWRKKESRLARLGFRAST
jgi:GTP-binding protein Era